MSSKVSSIRSDRKRLTLYKRWTAMKCRCLNTNDARYKRYGGRGISVCEEWMLSFDTFERWSIENGYRAGLTIDRIDNDGNYEPSNCRWVSRKVNSRNRGCVTRVTAFGETMTPQEWMEDDRCKAPSAAAIRKRIACGWGHQDSVSVPASSTPIMVTAFGVTKNLKEWSTDSRCMVSSPGAIGRRIKAGWEPEAALSTPTNLGPRPKKNA